MNYIILIYTLFYIAVLCYCIISEIRSQDCIDTCENQAPTYQAGDDLHDIIAEGTQTLYETVFWRRAFIVALIIVGLAVLCAIIFHWDHNWAQNSGVPRGIDLAIAILFIFLVVYFIFMFIEDNFWKPIGIQIRNASQLI